MFSSGPAQHALGRPQDRRSAAGSSAPVRDAGCCRGLHVRLAWRSLFFVFTPLHACRLSDQPFFSACFPLFPTSTRKCVCVCTKKSKYPQAKSPATPMVPFVVEALGRLSPEAHALLATVAPADKKVRSQVLRTAKQTLSVLVQTGLAELLLSAEPGRGLAAPAAAAA